MSGPQKEHQWLQQFVGEWAYESEAFMGPGKPLAKAKGTEVVRSIGGVWIVGESVSALPDGTPMTAIMTIGFDPEKKKFVGSWVGSVATCLWRYEGYIDPAGTVLTLETEGPNMSVPGTMARYKDVIEAKSKDLRLFSSWIQMPDGHWFKFVSATYRRTK